MSFHIIIPARYASSRLPGKPLINIAGKPMIQHVYERATESNATSIIIATDDERIAKASKKFGADVCMTEENHPSGTDRLAEVIKVRQFDDDALIINVQGDEPCLPAELITQVAEDLAHHTDAAMASLYSKITQPEDIFDPNSVKVIMDHQGYALYFSRAPIPWLRNHFSHTGLESELSEYPHYRHIGLYGYRAGFLKQYSQMQSCDLEKHESLEQLRVLFYGKRIHMSEAKIDSGHGVDTEADLTKVRTILK